MARQCRVNGVLTPLIMLIGYFSSVSAMMVTPESQLLYFSEQNWARNATMAISVNPGSYLKLNFSGSSTVSLALAPNDANPESQHYMNIVYSIDNAEFVEAPIFANATRIELGVRQLNSSEAHDIQVYIYNSLQGNNRWSNPTTVGGAALVVLGVELDDSATLHPLTELEPKRCLLYGDSITEGVNAQCHNAPTCKTNNDLCHNAATKTWGRAVAAAFGCEYSQVGFGGLGWSVSGGGGVVPVYTPGDPQKSSWNQIYAGSPRTFQNIDYVFALHATNDGLRHGTVANVIASVTGWLKALRSEVGPLTHIFVVVPFGSFGQNQAPIGALKAGFDAYQKDASDSATHFIDLGPTAAKGLSHWGASVQGCDGIHPRGGSTTSARHGELGAMIAVQATLALAKSN